MTRHRPARDPDIQLVTVLRASDGGLVVVAKSLLEDAGIDYYVRGETLRNVMGWGGPGVFNSAVGDAEFQVREADAPDALRCWRNWTAQVSRSCRTMTTANR